MSAGTVTEAREPLALIRALFHELEVEPVAYCHWKSTTSLDVALAGQTDLDLLVRRDDIAAFRTVATRLGFRQFQSHTSRSFPDVEDWLGVDEGSGRLVHLHVYRALILGQQYVKNHRLPIEDVLIDRSSVRDGVRVPPPELELVVLSLRILLKYRDVDAVKDRLRLGRRPGMERGALAELLDLADRADPDAARRAIAELLPSVRIGLVDDLVAAARHDPRDAAALVSLRREARRSLRPYQRTASSVATVRYLRARAERTWPLTHWSKAPGRRQRRRKTPLRGGWSVAFVGADGAGKSTVIAGIDAWLRWRVNVATIYMGSAQPSRGTQLLKLGVRVGRAARRRRGQRGSAERPIVLTALRYLGDAQDRRRRARRGRELAEKGAVVIFDRYPLPGLVIDEHPMDGPRIRALLGDGSLLLRALADREEAVYRGIPMPDHVVVLHVPADVALGRKVHRDPEAVRAKAAAIEQFTSGAVSMSHVDATQPPDEVLRTVKAVLWARM